MDIYHSYNHVSDIKEDLVLFEKMRNFVLSSHLLYSSSSNIIESKRGFESIVLNTDNKLIYKNKKETLSVSFKEFSKDSIHADLVEFVQNQIALLNQIIGNMDTAKPDFTDAYNACSVLATLIDADYCEMHIYYDPQFNSLLCDVHAKDLKNTKIIDISSEDLQVINRLIPKNFRILVAEKNLYDKGSKEEETVTTISTGLKGRFKPISPQEVLSLWPNLNLPDDFGSKTKKL